MLVNELEQLLQRLEEGDCRLRRPDFEMLSDLNRNEMEDFAGLYRKAPAAVRLSLISALAHMTHESFEYNFDRIFKGALDDPDPQVRAGAIGGLWESEDVSLAGRYVRLLRNDPDERVRAAAAFGLGHFVYLAEVEDMDETIANEVETALFTVVHDPDETLEVRRRAIESLGFSSNPDVPALLRDAYEDGDRLLRVSALTAMGRSASRRWRKVVLREVESPDSEIRMEAVRACGELELREAVSALTRLIEQDKDLDIRKEAVRALGQAGGRAAQKVLELLIDTEEGPLFDAAQDAMDELIFASSCPEISDLIRQDEEEEEDEELYLADDDDLEDWDDPDEEEDTDEDAGWSRVDDDLDDEDDEDDQEELSRPSQRKRSA